MELLESIYHFSLEWIETFSTIQGGLQLADVIFCVALAALTHKHWQRFIARLLGDLEQKGFIQFLLRASNRIAFPMSMLLYLILTRFVLDQFGVNTAVLDIFTPLLLSLAGIRLGVFILRSGFAPSPALRAWENVFSLLVWSVLALHLLGWLPDVIKAMDEFGFTFGEARFSILALIELTVSIIVFIVLANWLSRFIESRAKRSQYLNPSMRVVLTKTSKFMVYGLAILFALKAVGIDFTAFAVFSGAVGVGIGFGLQKIFSNFISGFILIFDRSIKPGDVITIGNRFGWVQELNARYVVVRDRDGVEALIPNENLITSEVTNWSYSDRSVRQRLPVSISYADDPELAMKLMVESAMEHPRALKTPEPVARLLKFGDNGIELELRIWIEDPEMGVANVTSDINLAFWKRFKQNNITIPFPQRDVHMIESPESA
ncbi:MAG: mechanosensitive ion channel [Thiotrichales bacterium]|nr:MAG: mechanosensitive ion channel [Thiotrichales bacterium]